MCLQVVRDEGCVKLRIQDGVEIKNSRWRRIMTS